jgi:hypothetical protein
MEVRGWGLVKEREMDFLSLSPKHLIRIHHLFGTFAARGAN